MSDTERNTGKLIPISLLEGETNEQYAFNVLGGKKEEYNATFLEELLDKEYKKWFLYDGILYKVENERSLDDDDVFHANKNSDGTINYVLRFYNGGCGFTEAMETALERMN